MISSGGELIDSNDGIESFYSNHTTMSREEIITLPQKTVLGTIFLHIFGSN